MTTYTAEVSHLTWPPDVLQTHSKQKVLYEAVASVGWRAVLITLFYNRKENTLNIYSGI